MLKISNTGRAADIAAQLRGVQERLVPVIVAKALTFTAQRAQASVVAQMRTVFDRPTAYTLASTRVVPAKPDALTARLAVKDVSPNNGTLPEDYLLPSVNAGQRKAKRFERAMRYAGVLGPRGFAVLGKSVETDAAGNLPKGEMQRILTATKTAFDPYQRKTDSRRSKRNATKAQYFVAGLEGVSMVGGELVRSRRSRLPAGIYKRVGRGVLPVLIFTSRTPSYRKRLPFEQIASEAAEREMAPAFQRAWRATVKA